MDGRAAEREPRRLERAAVRAREHLADRQPEPAHPAADRARVGTTLRREVPLRRAVRDDDGILIGLGEVGRGVAQHDDETARAKCAREVGAGRGRGSGNQRQSERGDESSTSVREDTLHLLRREQMMSCYNNSAMAAAEAGDCHGWRTSPHECGASCLPSLWKISLSSATTPPRPLTDRRATHAVVLSSELEAATHGVRADGEWRSAQTGIPIPVLRRSEKRDSRQKHPWLAGGPARHAQAPRAISTRGTSDVAGTGRRLDVGRYPRSWSYAESESKVVSAPER